MTDAQKNVSSYVINQLRKQDFVKELKLRTRKTSRMP